MTRALFGLLILLKIVLYSKYENRHMRRHEGCTVAVFRRSVFRHKVRVQISLSEISAQDIHMGDWQVSTCIYAHTQIVCPALTLLLWNTSSKTTSHMQLYCAGQATSIFASL